MQKGVAVYFLLFLGRLEQLCQIATTRFLLEGYHTLCRYIKQKNKQDYVEAAVTMLV